MSLNLVQYELRKAEIEFRDNRAGRNRLRCLAHLHRDLELVCMLEGDTVAYADSERYELHAGDIFLTFPNQVHFYESHGVEKYFLGIIKPDIMPDLMEVFTMGVPESAVIRGAAKLPRISQLLEQLAQACARNAPQHEYTHTLRRGYLLALFSELLSMMTISKLTVGDSGALRSIVSFCAQNFTEDLSLSLLEEKLHLNKYYISHLFSEKLGLRFNDYVNSLRISEACRYLLNSDHSVTEISEIVGFNTLRTFNRAFIKQIGVSPSEYRKNESVSTKRQKGTIFVGDCESSVCMLDF